MKKKRYGGALRKIPVEIVNRMLECQQEQGNSKNPWVFENTIIANKGGNGFDWDETKEGADFWSSILLGNNFNVFFEQYNKIENRSFDLIKII